MDLKYRLVLIISINVSIEIPLNETFDDTEVTSEANEIASEASEMQSE